MAVRQITLLSFLVSSLAWGLAPLWTVTDGIDTPESVYLDPSTGRVFVSNIVGDGTKKDKQGWISLLDVNGRVVKPKWFTGLNAPKGLRAHKGVLWVSDIDSVVAIDIKTAKQKSKLTIKDAKFLNDVVVSSDGTVYVSDTLGSKIFAIKRGKASVFVEGPEWESPNGLYLLNGKLIVAAWGLTTDFSDTKGPGHLYSIDLKTKEKTLIVAEPLGNLDGLEVDTVGNYIVSDWAIGKIFYIQDGVVQELVSGVPGVADLGYVPTAHSILVPYMKDNKVVAFPLLKAP